MELFGNTFFWLFFFMIGFVATIELIEDLGGQFSQRLFHRTIESAWLIIGYVVLIILFIRMLRLFGTTYTWTANALRNGALMYTCFKLTNRRAFNWMLVPVFISFWPFWNWNGWAALAFAGTLVLLGVLNWWRTVFVKNKWLLLIVTTVTSAVLWLFDMVSYGYRLGQTLSIIICFVVVMVITYYYDRLLAYRKRRTHELEYDTQHDVLTGVHSLKKFENDFTRFRSLMVQGQMPSVHLIMIDIDHFKRINDTYGHLVGDAVLKRFAQHCDSYLDQLPYPCNLYRTGGEEFSIIVTGGATDAQVSAVMTGYRQALKQFVIKTAKSQIKLTVSVGVTSINVDDDQNNQVIRRADEHLYAAKRAGRDQVIMDRTGA